MKTKFTNAVIRDGFAYGLDEGMLSCIDIATGARNGRRASTATARCCWSAICCWCSRRAGDVALVEANPEAYQRADALHGRQRTKLELPGLERSQAAGAQRAGSGLLRVAASLRPEVGRRNRGAARLT